MNFYKQLRQTRDRFRKEGGSFLIEGNYVHILLYGFNMKAVTIDEDVSWRVSKCCDILLETMDRLNKV